uniref:Uncharacterized protein n=1 Tax=candidate division WOR-3 bacterium TaxID=2052148 RepID=A0A7C4CCJ8_UNCW3
MDPTKRIAKWNAKFDTERVKETLDDLRPGMAARVQAVFPLLVAMETQVKQVLDGQGVPIIQYPFYLSFGREVWRLLRQELSGESLKQEVAVLVAKWVARGLELPVLQAVRDDVFNIGAPASP